jgi:hypothetical protein
VAELRSTNWRNRAKPAKMRALRFAASKTSKLTKADEMRIGSNKRRKSKNGRVDSSRDDPGGNAQ